MPGRCCDAEAAGRDFDLVSFSNLVEDVGAGVDGLR